MFSKFVNFVADNSVLGNAEAEEKKLRDSHPILLDDDEHVVFAFLGRGGSGRDSSYLTDKRLLIRDVKGMTGSRKQFKSTPYHIVKAWSVSTAGGGMDSDSELEIWASGMGRQEIEFSKDSVDLFAIQQFLNAVILPKDQLCSVTVPSNVEPGAKFQMEINGQTVTLTCPPHLGPGSVMEAPIPTIETGKYQSPGPGKDESTVSSFMSWLGDDAMAVDVKELEQRLKSSPAVLEQGETVEMAFKSRRDFTVFTPKRFIMLDKRGVTGKKVKYISILWKCMRAFAIETAGTFDMDAEMKLWTNIGDGMKKLELDLKPSCCDVMAVQKFLSDKILGMDSKPWEPVNRLEGQSDSGAGLLAWLGDDMRQLDAGQADAQFHQDPPILQGSERCEMAFKGRRDMILFTSKRFISIDVQGWTGRKKEYLSVPWSSVKGFGVKSAGSFLDKDSEMMLWTDIMYDEPGESRSGKEEALSAGLEIAGAIAGAVLDADVADDKDDSPEPGMSFIEMDFQKDKVDLMAINRYLSARCLPGNLHGSHIQVPPEVTQAAPEGSLGNLLSWLGDDNRQINAKEIEAQLQQSLMLLPEETVAMAFKSGRDSFILTSRRILVIDVQGFSGKRILYKSVPYASVRAFAVESAGTFDRDAELKIYTRNHWDLSKLKLDLRQGKADILAIQSYMASQILGTYDGLSAFGPDKIPDSWPSEVGGVEGFLGWLGDDAHQIDAEMVNQRLHQETPILLPDEVVDMAFKCGRDMYVHTSKRVLFVDVQGWTGKKVEYLSVPLTYCTGFSVTTGGGMLDRDAEVKIYTDVPEIGKISQDLYKGKADVMVVQRAMAAKLMK